MCPAQGELYWYLGLLSPGSLRHDALVHLLGDVALQPDDKFRTDGNLLGELTRCHTSVDAG